MSKLDRFKQERDSRATQTPFGTIGVDQLRELAALANQELTISEGEMMVKGVKLTSIGAEIPAELSGDDLQAVLQIIARLEGSLAWIVGDLLVYGENRKYGDAMQWAALFDRSPGTIYNWCSVCRAYPKSSRRRELSWKHHEVVQGHAERVQLLEMAVIQGLSAAELRKVVYPPVLPSGWEPTLNAIETRMMNLVKKGADQRAIAARLRNLADKIERGG